MHKKDFEITRDSTIETFLDMVVEQNDKSIKIHLDHYVQEVEKSLRPKKVLIFPGISFKAEDVSELPDPLK